MTAPTDRARLLHRLTLAALFTAVAAMPAHAVTIDWVTVGDPNNAADTTGDPNPAGAVAESFRIMRYEWTNSQYVQFLNAVDPQGTNPNEIWNADAAYNPRGGITATGTTNGSRYAAKASMGDKPVIYVSWFDAARVANWLHNGAQTYGSSDASASAPQNTGAYTLGTATSGNAVAVNSGAQFYIPTENQWYKAAYYKGGSTSGGYWDYATQSDLAPTDVTAGLTGNGSAGNTGNFANYNLTAEWNDVFGNVTTVGTNGGPSAYSTFDMSGNVWEWNDLAGAIGSSRGVRGGSYNIGVDFYLSSSFGETYVPSEESIDIGFRLASPVAVPEPSTWVMGLAGLVCGGFSMWRRRTRPTTQHRCGTSLTTAVTSCLVSGSLSLGLASLSEAAEIFMLGVTSGSDSFIVEYGKINSTTGEYTQLVGNLSNTLYYSSLTWVPSASSFLTFRERDLTTITTGGSVGGVVGTVPAEGDGLSWINHGLARAPTGTTYAYNFENDTFGTVLQTTPAYSEVSSTGIGTLSPVGGRIAFHDETLYAAFNLGIGEEPFTEGAFGTMNTSTGGFTQIAGDAIYQSMVLASDGTTLFGITPTALHSLNPSTGATVATVPLSGSLPEYWSGAAVIPVPVPEPSTAAMALAGLACGGYSMFRRRKRI